MTSAWILIVGCAVVAAAPVVARLAQRRFDPFEPITIFALAFGVMFVLRPSVMIAEGSTGFWGVDFTQKLPVTMLLAFVGSVSFVCAYELGAGVALARRLPFPGPLDPAAATAGALLVAAAGLVAFVVILPASDPSASFRAITEGRGEALRGVVRDSSTYLWYASWLLAPAALVLIGLALSLRRRALWLAASVVLGLALIRTVPLGSRIVLLPLLGGVLVLAYVMRGRRPGGRTIALLLVSAIVVSYVMVVVRDPERRSDPTGEIQRILDRPDALLYPLTRGEDAEMSAALSAALTVVPDELGYRWGGATLGDLVTRPVPRELWAGKPLPAREQIVEHVWPQFFPGLNPAFSPLLSFYWDFGLVGVALGMGLFGVAARALYAWFLASKGSFAAQLVFASCVWFTVIGIRNDPVDTVVFALFLVAPVLAIVAISGRTGRLSEVLRSSRGTRGVGASPSAARDAAPR